MRRCGPFTLGRVLGLALAIGIAANPASALGGTISNGTYTAAPGERNFLQVMYEPGTDSYTFWEAAGLPVADGDGLGGCSVVSSGKAGCPAGVIPPGGIAVMLGDQADGGIVGFPGVASTNPAERLPPPANEPRINTTLFGEAGNDVLDGGLGRDRLDGGLGADFIVSYERVQAFPYQQPGFQAEDTVVCGAGEDPIINATADSPFERGGDWAEPGDLDRVGSDCETVMQPYLCPPGGPPCEGEVVVQAAPPGRAATTAAVRKKKRKKKRASVVLGSRPFSFPAGFYGPVGALLNPARVGRALHGKTTLGTEFQLRLKTGRANAASAKNRKKKRKRKRGRYTIAQRIQFQLTK